VFGLSLVALSSWIIDPYQVFHDHWFDSPGYDPRMRVQAPGLIRTFIDEIDDHDTVIMGASLCQNFKAAEVAAALGGKKALQLSLAGGSPKEQNFILEHALRSGKIRKVLKGVNTNYVDNDIHRLFGEDFPFHLYSGYPLKYLLGIDTVSSSITALAGRGAWKEDYNYLGYWADIFESKFEAYNSVENIGSMKDRLRQSRSKSKKRKVSLGQSQFKSVDLYILKLAEKYPDTEFYIVLPPASSFWFAVMPVLELENLLSMQGYLVEQAEHLHNVTVFGFQNLFYVTDNVANYYDLYHFRGGINSLMLERIYKNECMLTLKKWPAYKREVIENASQYEVFSSLGKAID